jgi:hypothetical protein
VETGVRAAAADRRAARRYAGVASHGIVEARVGTGGEVGVIDVSAGGALILAAHRLTPGARVQLHLRREDAPREVIRGRLLRCSVASVSASAITYRGALQFERALPWFPSLGMVGKDVPVTKSP